MENLWFTRFQPLTTDAPMTLLCTATNSFFGGNYDLIQLHKKIIHQNVWNILSKLIEIFTLSIFYSKFKMIKMTWLQMLFGLFFVPANGWVKPTQQLEKTLLLFHPLYFSCVQPRQFNYCTRTIMISLVCIFLRCLYLKAIMWCSRTGQLWIKIFNKNP